MGIFWFSCSILSLGVIGLKQYLKHDKIEVRVHDVTLIFLMLLSGPIGLFFVLLFALDKWISSNRKKVLFKVERRKERRHSKKIEDL